MKPSELQEKTCHQFDCAIKTVIRHRAIDFYRAIRRSEKKEMPFAEIMDDLLNCILRLDSATFSEIQST